MKLLDVLMAPYKYVYMVTKECSNYNSPGARKRSRTKQRAKKLFRQYNIPTAKGTTFITPWKAFSFVNKHGFPVVVKPNFGGYSRGSFFPITNKKELLRASLLAKFYWPKTIIEEYVQGKNYRVIATNKEIIVATQRYPPFVDGTGRDSIAKLIDAENHVRKKMRLYPVVHPIEKSEETIEYLRKQGLALDSIPKKRQRIFIHNKVALAVGGVLENFSTTKISKKNKNLLLKIVKIFDADVFGIDIICEKDISKDFDKQRCIILEVNSRSYLPMHSVPRYGKPVDADKKIRKAFA